MKKETGYYIYVADIGTKHQNGFVTRVAYVKATSPREAVKKAKEQNTNIQPYIGKRRYKIYAEVD